MWEILLTTRVKLRPSSTARTAFVEFNFLILWNSGIIGTIFFNVSFVFFTRLLLARVTIPGVFCNSFYANGEETDAMWGGAKRGCSWDEQRAGRTKSSPAGRRPRAILKPHAKPASVGGYSARLRRSSPASEAGFGSTAVRPKAALRGAGGAGGRAAKGAAAEGRSTEGRSTGTPQHRRPQHRCERADAHGSPQSGSRLAC
jgi:hypothetical protein